MKRKLFHISMRKKPSGLLHKKQDLGCRKLVLDYEEKCFLSYVCKFHVEKFYVYA